MWSILNRAYRDLLIESTTFTSAYAAWGGVGGGRGGKAKFYCYLGKQYTALVFSQ